MEPTFCLEITRGDAGGSALRVELQLMLVSPLGVGKQGNLHMQDHRILHCLGAGKHRRVACWAVSLFVCPSAVFAFFTVA